MPRIPAHARWRRGAQATTAGRGVTRSEVTRPPGAVRAPVCPVAAARTLERRGPGSHGGPRGAVHGARRAMRGGLALGAGAARAGGDSGRVPDFGAPLAGALQVSEAEGDLDGTWRVQSYPGTCLDTRSQGNTGDAIPS